MRWIGMVHRLLPDQGLGVVRLKHNFYWALLCLAEAQPYLKKSQVTMQKV